MTNTTNTQQTRNIQFFRAERNAKADHLGRALWMTIVAATLFAGTALFSAGHASAMQLNAGTGDAPWVMAYAEPLPERFGMTDGIYTAEQDHELNDAWMGMTAISADGVVLGYITDAFVNPDGSIDEIVIAPAGNGVLATAVYVPADAALLTAQDVKIALDARAVAMLEPATDLAFLGE